MCYIEEATEQKCVNLTHVQGRLSHSDNWIIELVITERAHVTLVSYTHVAFLQYSIEL